MGAGKLTRKLVISLDFELLWGRYDRIQEMSAREIAGIRRTPETVRRLLTEMSARSIKATWATVGALACTSWNEFFDCAPVLPKYRDPRFSFNHGIVAADPQGIGFFAPALIEEIIATPGQELGTHTFCHSFFCEDGVTRSDLANDLACARGLSERKYGLTPVSLVFPRNQSNFVDLLPSVGIRIWRGNETPWYYQDNRRSTHFQLLRALRMVDSINPMVRRGYALEGNMTRASLFLRLNLPASLWAMHMRRIASELRGLRSGEVFHLWFHPENLPPLGELGFARLTEVLDMIAAQLQDGGLESSTMGDLVALGNIKARESPTTNSVR
jgi:hypothetical protein